jgi:hypothetical protein
VSCASALLAYLQGEDGADLVEAGALCSLLEELRSVVAQSSDLRGLETAT